MKRSLDHLAKKVDSIRDRNVIGNGGDRGKKVFSVLQKTLDRIPEEFLILLPV